VVLLWVEVAGVLLVAVLLLGLKFELLMKLLRKGRGLLVAGDYYLGDALCTVGWCRLWMWDVILWNNCFFNKTFQ
jgi:hypothetical protein